MARSIRIKMMDKDVELDLSSNILTQSTVKSQFLLPPDSVISLSYEVDGRRKGCEVNEAGTCFLLPNGWQGMQFFMESDKVPSRLATPMIVDSPILPDEEDEINLMKKYVYTVDGVVACATAMSVNILASCYHCIKHCITTGPDVDEISSHRKALINLTHAVTGRKIKAKIRIYSIEKDVALLQTDENLMVGDEIIFRGAYLGQPYYVIGTPISDDGSPLQVISGRISAILDYSFSKPSIHSLHGHGSARLGASGGPVFARRLTDAKPTLLGIVVAGQSISHETTLLTFVSSNYVKIISFETLHGIYLLSEKDNFKL